MEELQAIAVNELALVPGRSLALAVPLSPALQSLPAATRRAAVHLALRSALGQLTGRPAESLRMATTAQGKPHLEGPASVAFSLSHSRTHALIALSRSQAVGCDIEDRLTGDDAARLSPLVLHPTELETLRRLPAAQRQDAFLQYWVRKEAVLKASGSGFLDDPRRVIAGLDNARAAWSPGDGPRFHLHNRWIAAGCLAAVAGNDAACDWRVFPI